MAKFTTRPVIVGRHGIVASEHYLSAMAGLSILERGGNAIDAGVAGAFVLEVVKPHNTGIAGEIPILIAPARGWQGKPVVAVNGQGWAPKAMTIDWFRRNEIDLIPGDGLLPAMVPGAFGALATSLLHFGTMSLAEVMEAAIDLAESGFPVYGELKGALAKQAAKYLEQWPSTAEIFLPGGAVPEIDDMLVQADWARTFKAVVSAEIRAKSRGREAGIQAALDYFYCGPVAQKLCDFAQNNEVLDASGKRNRGFLTAEDFAEYKTKLEAPVSFDYRGYEVCKCGPWTQGPVFLQQLALLEGYDLAKLGHNSPEYVHLLMECAKLAFADREAYYGDPDFVDVPLDRLLSKEYARQRRELIDMNVASRELRPGDAELVYKDPGERPETFRGDTTHVDVVDAEGNLFAATPSGGWIASSPVVPGLGFPLGTRGQMFWLDEKHPNGLQPGKRPRTTLTPSLALRDGKPWLAFGTVGGDGQDQWTLQFFLNVVDFGMDLQEAIDAPTFHTLHFPNSFYPRDAHPARIEIEDRLPAETLDALRAKGHDVRVIDPWINGQVTAAEFDRRKGVLRGAASPRLMVPYAVGR